MRPFHPIFLLAACSSAIRSRRSASTKATARKAASTCGSCSALSAKMSSEAWNAFSSIGASDTAVGHEYGPCCRTTNRFGHVPDSVDVFSASKMVSSYTILHLVDLGLLSLETKAADIFDWWTATDNRSQVTLRHLLSQTSGSGLYPLGLGACTDGLATGNGTRWCARQAYNSLFPTEFTPGTIFKYTESTFYIASAMALEVTGLQHWDQVFQRYMAGPLGIDQNICKFSLPTYSMAFAGGGLKCTTLAYARILQAILGKTMYNDKTLYDEAERPHTLDYPPTCTPDDPLSINRCGRLTSLAEQPAVLAESNASSGFYWHYGLGQWTECATPRCEGGILRTSSIGLMGTYPWMDRGELTGHRPHWGVVVRNFLVTGRGVDKIRQEVMPIAAAAVQ